MKQEVGRSAATKLLLLLLICGLAQSARSESFERRLVEGMRRCPELTFIRRTGKALGVRVWLFGGSAAAYAHYVRRGPARYDFHEIFRSTQDVDLAVDGSLEAIQAFTSSLEREFPYFLNDRSVWEIRPLHGGGAKPGLMDDPDFGRQNTDSQSTGLIEITESAEPLVRDLLPGGHFLEDATAGRVRYVDSPEHAATRRASSGKNPPILSAIRYLIKSFQYGLTRDPADMKKIEAIVREWDPRAKTSPYVHYWLERNAPKLFRHAADLREAWDVCEAIGLRAKLVALGGLATVGSAAWWMDREPLRDVSDPRHLAPRGDSKHEASRLLSAGRTAGELGIAIVTHEAGDYAAYESIRSNPNGRPNALVSREGRAGEDANHGAGFYTAIGSFGGAHSGFHIRMRVDPNARENVDFFLVGRDWVVWLTRDKLSVVREPFDPSPIEALAYLASPRTKAERGVREFVKRRLRGLTANEPSLVHEVERFIDEKFEDPSADPECLVELLELPVTVTSPRWFDWVEKLLAMREVDGLLIEKVLSLPHSLKYPEWNERWYQVVLTLIHRGGGPANGYGSDIAREVLSKSHAARHPKWGDLTLLLAGQWQLAYNVIYQLLDRPAAIASAEWHRPVSFLIANYPEHHAALLREVLSVPEAIARPEWETLVSAIIERGLDVDAISYFLGREAVMASPAWPRLVEQCLAQKDPEIDRALVDHVFAAGALSKPEGIRLFERCLAEGRADTEIARTIFSLEEAKASPRYRRWRQAWLLPKKARAAFLGLPRCVQIILTAYTESFDQGDGPPLAH